MENLELFSDFPELGWQQSGSSIAPDDRYATLAAMLKRFPGNRCSQQCIRLAHALFTLRTISTHECREYLDIYSPPARKHDLTKVGIVIGTGWSTMRTANGDIRNIGTYVLLQSRRLVIPDIWQEPLVRL